MDVYQQGTQIFISWHNIISQKTWIFVSTTVRTSDISVCFNVCETDTFAETWDDPAYKSLSSQFLIFRKVLLQNMFNCMCNYKATPPHSGDELGNIFCSYIWVNIVYVLLVSCNFVFPSLCIGFGWKKSSKECCVLENIDDASDPI